MFLFTPASIKIPLKLFDNTLQSHYVKEITGYVCNMKQSECSCLHLIWLFILLRYEGTFAFIP